MHPDSELAHGWRPISVSIGGAASVYKGPDVPAGYHFFGKMVYRTLVQFTIDASSTILIPGFGSLQDLVDIWGCGMSGVTGGTAGVVHYHGFIGLGWGGTSGLRVRVDPNSGNLEINSGGILEFGGSSEGLPFPSTGTAGAFELVIFWTK